MRIGIDARFYGSLGKGLGRYTEKLIEHLESLDQENDYVVFLRRENFSEYVPRNPRFKKMEAQYAWYGFAEQTLFVFLLYRERLDLVHFPHFNVPLLYFRKFVVTIHDLILVHYPTLRNTTRLSFLYWIKFAVYRLVIAAAVHRAEHIITVSHFTERDIAKQYPVASAKMTVTYEAADLFCRFSSPRKERELFERLGLLERQHPDTETSSYRDIIQPYFLYVGNAYPHKNLSVLFTCAQVFPEYTLVLVGREDFFYNRLKAEAAALGIRNIIFAGFLSDQELASLYRFARIYVFPSLYEGFGLPPLEAMTCGTPVVASDRGSLPEILGDAALYFDPTSPDELIRTMRTLEEDVRLRESLQEKGYRQVALFRFGDMAAATYQVYRRVLKNKTPSHVTISSTEK